MKNKEDLIKAIKLTYKQLKEDLRYCKPSEFVDISAKIDQCKDFFKENGVDYEE